MDVQDSVIVTDDVTESISALALGASESTAVSIPPRPAAKLAPLHSLIGPRPIDRHCGRIPYQSRRNDRIVTDQEIREPRPSRRTSSFRKRPTLKNSSRLTQSVQLSSYLGVGTLKASIATITEVPYFSSLSVPRAFLVPQARSVRFVPSAGNVSLLASISCPFFAFLSGSSAQPIT